MHTGMDQNQKDFQIALGLVSLISSCAGLVIMFTGATVALRVVHRQSNNILPSTVLPKQQNGSGITLDGSSQISPTQDHAFKALDNDLCSP